MKKTNTYLSNDCTRKVLVFLDDNGYYHLKRMLNLDVWTDVDFSREVYKHFHTAERACKKWVNK